MVLRRGLPSRLTGALPPEATPAPVVAPKPEIAAEVEAPQVAAPAPIATAFMPVGSAFSTLPTVEKTVTEQPENKTAPAVEDGFTSSAPARVLEDSFVSAPSVGQASAVVEEAAPQQPEQPQTPAIPEAVKAEPVPQETSLKAAEEEKTEAPASAPQGPTDFLSGAQLQASRPEGNASRRKVQRGGGLDAVLQQAAQAEKKNEEKTAPQQPVVAVQEEKPEIKIEPSAQPRMETVPEAQSQPVPARTKLPRNFAAATVVEATVETAAEKAVALKPESTLAPDVPIDTRPLSQVNEELIASGIMAPPPADSLTSNVPVSMAVAEEPLPDDFLFPAAASTMAPVVEFQAEPSTPVPSAFSLATAPYRAPQVAEQPAPASPAPSDGGLPWATPSAQVADWEIDMPTLPQEGAQSSTPIQPPADIFKNVTTTPAAMPQATPAPSNAPWVSVPGVATPATRSATPPPELPSQRVYRPGGQPLGKGGMFHWGSMVGAAAVVGLGLFAWNHFNQSSEMLERMGRWTGGLQANNTIAPSADPILQGLPAEQPQGSFTMVETTPSASSTMLTPPMAAAEDSNAKIEFAPPATSAIAADGTEKMPEDISVFAKFQKAVADARAQQKGVSATEAVAQVVNNTQSKEKLTPQQLQEELAAYRRTLTENSGPLPKPTEFIKDPNAYMDGRNNTPLDTEGAPVVSGQGGTLLPPPVEGGTAQKQGLLPPPELYTNNPKKLPIMGEPIANAPARVRTLEDFGASIEPETAKVRIPKGIKPRFAASDFPSLEVLSFVPSRGIIAYADGREGVLMIGETINGWELVNVTSEMAEFKSGQKSHYLTLND